MGESFRCPRDSHMSNFAMCAGRKDRKHHGCGTCRYPAQVERDRKLTTDLVVGLNLTPKPSEKYTGIIIKGLSAKPITISRMVARDLLEKLQVVVQRKGIR
jgi:hypothetical protein